MESTKAREERIIETLGKCDDVADPVALFQELNHIAKIFGENQVKRNLLQFFNALSNDRRFLILDSLKSKDRCVCELEAISSKAQPSVSHHLKVLEEANLIKGWKRGKFTHYSLVKKELTEIKALIDEWFDSIENWA